jgi:hypothetical protein
LSSGVVYAIVTIAPRDSQRRHLCTSGTAAVLFQALPNPRWLQEEEEGEGLYEPEEEHWEKARVTTRKLNGFTDELDLCSG